MGMKQAAPIWLVCALSASIPARAQTATETVVYSFLNCPRGAQPYAPLARDSAGDLYGTTNQGGAANLGVVFKLTASGTQTILHSFMGGSDGAYPYSGVLLRASGTIYGTAYQGGASNAGVVYEIGPSGHEKVLYSFTGGVDGGNPYAGVVADSAGNLYGATYGGGTANAGLVYKLAPSGQETVLYNFTGKADGANPYAGVILDSGGNLYGTTLYGGSTYCTGGCGVVYKISPGGQLKVLYSFPGGPGGTAWPYAGVIRDSAGNLYGAASTGGTLSGGVLYKIDAAGNFSLLHTFNPYDQGPWQPDGGLAMDSAGNLYGTTQFVEAGNGHGVVYKLDTARNLTTLYVFPGESPGVSTNYINAGVIVDAKGNVYGATPYGGLDGTVYEVDAAGQASTLYSFSPAPGGTRPFAGVARDSAGNLYGATQLGGASNWGVVYRVDATGGEKALYSFAGGADGAFPESTPVLDRQGNVYGAALKGGSASGISGFGVVYKLTTNGQETVLHTFTNGSDGGYPGAVALDSAGNLYGAAGGGAAGGGVIYKVTLSGQFILIYSFTGGTDGGGPGGVVLDADGNLYGTTYGGGAAGYGVIFKLSPSGQETVLYSFPGGSDGAAPEGLTRDSAGNLYGATSLGGGAAFEAGYGVVFEFSAAGDYTVLYRFTGGADGGFPESPPIRSPAGNLYGTTSAGGTTGCTGTGGCGVVYEVSTSGQLTVLHAFTGGADGANPYAGPVADAAGHLYGTTSAGGKGGMVGATSSGAGVVYKIAPR